MASYRVGDTTWSSGQASSNTLHRHSREGGNPGKSVKKNSILEVHSLNKLIPATNPYATIRHL